MKGQLLLSHLLMLLIAAALVVSTVALLNYLREVYVANSAAEYGIVANADAALGSVLSATHGFIALCR